MPTHLFDLTGRTALVTGALRRLGRAMAERLAAAGADILVNNAGIPFRRLEKEHTAMTTLDGGQA